ncbi:MAG: hypothetical protein RRC34_13910 [Lentisphaeria bacterium]|nr:hypothetical protein [Lentisphaeria bacterium]
MKQHDIQNFESWDEFRWEKALREGDIAAAKYFHLLKRFADLPAADELISDRMGPDFEDDMPDCDFDCDTCSDRWQCEFAPPLDWEMADDRDEDDEDDEDEGPEQSEAPLEPGDSLFYETRPVFRSLRQVALGWSNVYAVILPDACRPEGLKVLFNIGRALAYLSGAIGDGLYEQPARNLAFGKRALAAINTSLGGMDELIQRQPKLKNLLAAMRKHLLVARQGTVDQVQRTRKRLS